eukprot:4871013-Pyramimonas_sp.AAC.1
MAMARARPPKPRCNAAACWEGVMVPVVTLIQACTSRANFWTPEMGTEKMGTMPNSKCCPKPTAAA